MMNDEFKGYRRSDGKIDIRNVIVVAYLVECAHHVAREIQWPFRERDVHPIGFPGCYPNDYSQRMMCSLCTHPNVGAVLLFSLGCEGFNRFGLEKHIRESDRPVRTLVIQENEGTRQTITRGRRWVEEIIEKTPNRPKECASLGELVVGTICGGSDGTSGITANPAVGSAFDELVSQGATCIFEETGELIGCEEHMQTRAISSDLGLEIQRSMEKAALYYSTLGYGSFAPGNADGGLSSVEENPWEPMPNLDIVKFMGS